MLLKIQGILVALLYHLYHLICVEKKKISEVLNKGQIHFCHLKLNYHSATVCASDAENFIKVVKVELAVVMWKIP